MTNKTIYNNYSLGTCIISNASGSILFKILGKLLPDPYKVR